MGFHWRAPSDLSAKPTSALFYFGEKCEKNLYQAHLRALQHQLESEKKMNRALRENHEDLHWKPEQRSAPQSAQKCVSWRKARLFNTVQKNLVDQNLVLHHQELGCRRAAPQSAATRDRVWSSALPPAVPPAAAHGGLCVRAARGGHDLGHLDCGCGGGGCRGGCGGCGGCGWLWVAVGGCGWLWVVVVVVVVRTLLQACVCFLNTHARLQTNDGGRCPCGHDPRPCTCVQGPKKSTLTVSEHFDCETFEVICTLNHQASVIAHNGHATTLSKQEYD